MSKTIEQPQNTFVVRFWREWREEDTDRVAGWRGRIEHIQSGEGVTFYGIRSMLAFIRQYIPDLTSFPTGKHQS